MSLLETQRPILQTEDYFLQDSMQVLLLEHPGQLLLIMVEPICFFMQFNFMLDLEMQLDVQQDVEQTWQEFLLKFVTMETRLTIKDVLQIVEAFSQAGIVRMEVVVHMILALRSVEMD